MASPTFDRRRGVWSIQWWDGRKWVRSRVHTMPRWKPGGPKPKRPLEVTQALAEYQAKEQDIRRGRRLDPDRTVADFLAGYRAGYAGARAAGSLEQLDRTIRGFLAWCDAAKVAKLDDVTSAACRAWIADRAGQASAKTGGPIAHATLRKERALLAAAWAQAMRDESIARNPWLPVEVPARAVRRKRPSWTPEEYAKLLAASRGWLRDVIALGCHTGIRITALLGLEWRDVHWSDGPLGVIEVRQELDKSGKGYRVPVHPTAHEVLARRRIHGQGERILTSRSGRPTTMNVTGPAITAACRRAGLPAPVSPNHHMRRTFGRWAVLGHLTGKPVPIYVVSRWLGHSSVAQTEYYLDLKLDESAEWMAGGDHDGGSQAAFGHDPPSR